MTDWMCEGKEKEESRMTQVSHRGHGMRSDSVGGEDSSVGMIVNRELLEGARSQLAVVMGGEAPARGWQWKPQVGSHQVEKIRRVKRRQCCQG